VSNTTTRLAGYEAAKLLPLVVVVLSVFFLKLYFAFADPVLHAVDPWFWALQIESYSRELTTEHLSQPLLDRPGYGYVVYPRAYPLLATLVGLATGTSGYEIVRFYPIISALNLIPMYFLSLVVSKSRRIAIISIVLVSVSKWYSIRTSIGNAECFTHFWLVLSLLFLLRLRDSPASRNIIASVFFMTMTLMFWHFTIAIYAVFLPMLSVVNLRNRAYCRRIALVAVSLVFIAGALWYFWVDPVGWAVSLAMKIGTSLLPTQGRSSVLGLSLVESWGYLLLVLGILGLVYVLAREDARRDAWKTFLVVYVSSILVLIILSLRMGFGSIVYYLFSSLAFPLSVFAAIALVTAVDAMQAVTPVLWTRTRTLPRPFDCTGRRQSQILILIVIIMVLLANSNPVNYGGDTTFSVSYNGLITGGRETVEMNCDVACRQDSGWIATFQYGKAFDALSDDLYSALKWVRDNSGEQSCVGAFLTQPPPASLPGSVLRGAFESISERSFIEAKEFGSSLYDSPTAFHDDISKACGGNVYLVTGIRSWVNEDLADPHLESRFLSHAALSPDLFPEVHSVQEVRVFCIEKTVSQSMTAAALGEVRFGLSDAFHGQPSQMVAYLHGQFRGF
jgi:hypothetical protein